MVQFGHEKMNGIQNKIDLNIELNEYKNSKKNKMIFMWQMGEIRKIWTTLFCICKK